MMMLPQNYGSQALPQNHPRYLDQLQAEYRMLRQKPLDQMTQFEQQRMVFLLNEMDRINRDNQTVIQKFRPYARVIASGIEYADSKSIVKAIGALLFPYPYLVYRGYQSYKGKKK